ncbi:hypothetical protein [Sodalis sp. (in: enterobacteria)]|uniref:hypothetical protein n=1 Tax=Sodalis sp. (in: enterobacteria) TaxID=1898979 RepID=UPI003F688F1A
MQELRWSLNKWTANSPDLVRKRSGTKAFKYHIDCLPEQTREIIKQRHYKSLIAQSPALLERKVQALNDQQKQTADARMMLAQEVVRLQQGRHDPPHRGGDLYRR